MVLDKKEAPSSKARRFFLDNQKTNAVIIPQVGHDRHCLLSCNNFFTCENISRWTSAWPVVLFSNWVCRVIDIEGKQWYNGRVLGHTFGQHGNACVIVYGCVPFFYFWRTR